MHRIARSPEVRERLHRLRRELAKIYPAPSSADEARDEIVKAMGRAGLSGWTVPELSSPQTTRCAGGSVCIKLIAHVICINGWGAFRIVDLHAPQPAYFEMPGRDGRPFAPVRPQ